eukprot:5211880-Prymnesium_polylepis.1
MDVNTSTPSTMAPSPPAPFRSSPEPDRPNSKLQAEWWPHSSPLPQSTAAGDSTAVASEPPRSLPAAMTVAEVASRPAHEPSASSAEAADV